MRLYLRSRRAPAALGATVAAVAALWTLWSVFSDAREAGLQLVVLTVLVSVTALTATLGGPDDELDRTAALRWRPLRLAHLAAAFLVVVVPLLATLATGARFGPAALVARDAAGLLGLTALGAATVGLGRAWFLPLGWTLAATLFPVAEPIAGRILTWQAQPGVSAAAAVTAGMLALGGLVAYAMAGPARRSPAEAAQRT
ncbi:hypothetical protein [Actinoplanes subtropicus]|uniref:hypothetical protein n=1 Tax=Actinoplanes subtropicus TaxID=543632 RepID=UPI0004C41315|nr:hypothetical protein [Actinoplanes subtropicus]